MSHRLSIRWLALKIPALLKGWLVIYYIGTTHLTSRAD